MTYLTYIPSYIWQVRSVQGHKQKVFTGAYDGVVREYDLLTGQMRRVVADHGPYPVECIQFRQETGRLVSVDWSGILACSSKVSDSHPNTDNIDAVLFDDSRRLGSNYRLSPCSGDDKKRRILHYTCLGPRDEPPEIPEATLSSSIHSLQHDEDRVLMGTKDGQLLSLHFRRRL